ncbi:hypothetical protein [Leptolyngbya ohadii]|uniref:hypothetical protein n=1 Tax=Leptolyngbya ohadii TaxID=1962290 RepID=UPI000B59B5A0|nr:hypothetical protein [Leptolyngbya ohadii]
MLLIIASRYDAVAQTFVDQWSDREVGLLTSQDLSVKGWRWDTANSPEAIGVVGGKTVAARQIRGVLTRLPAVTETELPQIVPSDRAYVAAEMTAFLSGWLNSLSCPLLNCPTATCLMGPNWSAQAWRLAASQLGIPVQPLHQEIQWGLPSPVQNAREGIGVTVIGDRTVGDADPHLHNQAKQLAAFAEVHLLTARFSSNTATATLVGVDLWADIAKPTIASAIWNYLSGTI